MTMARDEVQLSVVMPVFNEAESIEGIVEDLGRELFALLERVEVIVVDDCSTDETAEILGRLAADRPWLDVQRAAENAGHGPSVMRGLALARADWVFQLDSDGQFVVSEFGRLWERRDDADLLLGVRESRHDPLHRLLLTRVVRIVTSLLAGRRMSDANTPFRLVRRPLVEEMRVYLEPGTLAPNILIALGASVRGWRVVDVPVTHLARERGVSTLRKVRLLKFSLRGLAQLVAFRYRIARAAPHPKALEEPVP
jgi:dolichol-phosphate mannosyltransferase